MTCVTIIMESGPMIIVTGSPLLSLALTMNEPGITFTLVKPSSFNFARISCGRFCAVWRALVALAPLLVGPFFVALAFVEELAG